MLRALPLLPALITALVGMAMLIHGPIAQTENYHAFADRADWLGIANARDVLSNLGFAVVGLWGIVSLWPRRRHPAIVRGWPGYALFLVGLCLTAVGSGYYHLAPDNARLVWDRLPIALACAGLLAGVWASTTLPVGRSGVVTALLAAYAIGSVLWWHFTELNGHGDLRPYLLLQILPLALIPLWQTIHGSPPADRWWFATALVLYVFAKLAEVNDQALLAATSMAVSGHTLKHLLATAAAAALVHRLAQSACTNQGDRQYDARG